MKLNNMRKLFFISALFFLLCSCDYIKYRELYEVTDEFVESLNTTYKSYGLFGGLDQTKYTKDKEYQVFPTGRLIIVKIDRYADADEYESLRSALESHYSGDKRVNQVYRNQGGTIVIDCRN